MDLTSELFHMHRVDESQVKRIEACQRDELDQCLHSTVLNKSCKAVMHMVGL